MKIVLEKVRMKNFLSFGAKWQEISFTSGINVILGVNGSGKSSMLVSILFALFGQTDRDIRKKEIINWSNKKNCEVQLFFRKNDIPYKIVRGIKPDKFEIYKNDTLIPRPSNVKDYQKDLEEIIGINYQIFSYLIHSNINSSEPILSMSKPQKRKFMERIFGLELYTYLNDKSNIKTKVVKDKIFENTISVEHNVKSINDAKERIGSLKRNLSSFGSSEIELNEEKERLNDIIDEYDGLQKRQDNITEEKSGFESKYSKFQLITRKIEDRKNIVNVKSKNVVIYLNKISKEEEEQKGIKEKERKLNLLISKNGNVEDLYKKIKESKTEIENLRISLDTLNNTLIQNTSNSALTKYYIESNEKRLKSLDGERSICPTCGQEISECGKLIDDIKLEIKDHKSHLKKIELETKNTKGKIKEKENRIKNIKGKIDSVEKIINNIRNIQSEVGTDLLKDYSKEKNGLNKKIKKYRSVISKLNILKDKMDKKRVDIDSHINILDEENLEIQTKLSNIKSIKDKIEKLEEKIKIENDNKKKIEEIIDSDNKFISDLLEKNILFRKKKRQYLDIIDYLEYIKFLCKDDQVKQYAISTIIPFLNKKTNFYLSEVGHPFYVVIDKWLDVIIKGPGITKGSYKSLSSGERRSVDLAVQLAFLDIAKLQSIVWPDVIVFDELLDSSVDSKSLNKLIDIIKVKQDEDSASKTFIISHRTEIGEFDADNTYFARKEKGYSNIVLE